LTSRRLGRGEAKTKSRGHGEDEAAKNCFHVSGGKAIASRTTSLDKIIKELPNIQTSAEHCITIIKLHC